VKIVIGDLNAGLPVEPLTEQRPLVKIVKGDLNAGLPVEPLAEKVLRPPAEVTDGLKRNELHLVQKNFLIQVLEDV
jgi:hypothetical protein